ncbi:hypothetical protein [Haloarchaeobius sp. HME9146]|uniref:hypothetical protein n=1 Tax=Haloarchaeobius sp. HME9146 TaxID=2978732 RepID=UPI0021BE7ED3|nr:hypothetical protein [Haloarchaeobius sp. HME9146]MCT9097443.1 hypothetical protein [Haloarchaeobius sp. HME9146]
MKLLQRLTGLFGSKDGSQSPEAATEQTASPTSPTDASVPPQSTPDSPTSEPAAPAAGGATESGGAVEEAKAPVEAEATAPEPEPEPRDRTEVFREQAAACVEDWPAAELDYSLASLERLDDLATELATEGARDKQLVLSLGSYFGETLLREAEGEWQKPDSGAWAVVLTGEETDVTLNVFQIADSALAGTSRFAATFRSVEQRL